MFNFVIIYQKEINKITLIFGWRHQALFTILCGMNIMEAKWVAKEFHVDLNSAEGPGWDVSQNSPWTASCVTDLCKRCNDEVISMTARERTESENQQCDIHTSGTQLKKMMTLLTHVYNVACICHNKLTISVIKVQIFPQIKSDCMIFLRLVLQEDWDMVCLCDKRQGMDTLALMLSMLVNVHYQCEDDLHSFRSHRDTLHQHIQLASHMLLLSNHVQKDFTPKVSVPLKNAPNSI